MIGERAERSGTGNIAIHHRFEHFQVLLDQSMTNDGAFMHTLKHSGDRHVFPWGLLFLDDMWRRSAPASHVTRLRIINTVSFPFFSFSFLQEYY